MSDQPHTDLAALIATDPWTIRQILEDNHFRQIRESNEYQRTVPDEVVQQTLGINDRKH